MKNDKVELWQARTCLALLCADLVLLIGSWIYTSLFPLGNVRSLLSAEATRWIFRNCVDRLSSPCIVWILLSGITWGCLTMSGLWSAMSCRRRPLLYREKAALKVCCVILLTAGVCLFLLTCIPHAILLSATGQLFPSPYSPSIVPMACVLLCGLSVVYGYVSGTFTSIVQVFHAMTDGVKVMASWVIVCLLALFSYSLCCYIMGCSS